MKTNKNIIFRQIYGNIIIFFVVDIQNFCLSNEFPIISYYNIETTLQPTDNPL
jgi:hypothetical protein